MMPIFVANESCMKNFPLALFLCIGFSAQAQKIQPVLLENGTFQYRNAGSGTPAFSVGYETASPFQNGFAVVSNDHHYQVINTAGEPVSEPRWAEISPASNGYALAYGKDGNRALLKEGKNIFESKARLAGMPTHDGLVPFQQPETGKMGILNVNTGKEVLTAQYDHIRPLSEGVAAALAGNAWKFIDLSGKPISAQQYESANAFSEGLAAVRRNGKWGFVNKKEDWVVSAQYDRVTDFRNGTAFAQNGDSWKQITSDGRTLRELPFQMVIEPTEGLFAFMQNNLWGFAEAATGKIVIEPQYLRTASFENGLAFVVKDGKQFYIQPDGTELRTGK